MINITVRAARAEEFDTWYPLWRGYQALTHETNADAMKLYDRIAEKPGFVQYRKAF